MTISAQLAQNIIDSLASVLQQQLNFFDKNGMIMASTKKEGSANITPARRSSFRKGWKNCSFITTANTRAR